MMEHNYILAKKVKFNNKNWLAKIDNERYVKVFLCDANYNEIESNERMEYTFYGSSTTLLDMCKQSVLWSNDVLFPVNQYEEFMKWDGNLDNTENDLIFIQDVEELNYMKELNTLSKIESKTFNDELRIKWIQEYFTNKLMTRVQRL